MFEGKNWICVCQKVESGVLYEDKEQKFIHR